MNANASQGIRIENLVEVVKSDKPGFLEFRPLTYFPLQQSLIVKSMLTPEEVEWIDNYHAATKAKVSPLLAQQSRADALAWLEKNTAPMD